MPLTSSGAILQRLKEAAGVKKDKDLAAELGINQQGITNAKKRKVPVSWIARIHKKFGYSFNWLNTGVGPKLDESGADTKRENSFEYEPDLKNQNGIKEPPCHEKYETMNPDSELIAMAMDVLSSRTIYSEALRQNIKAFHKAVREAADKKEPAAKSTTGPEGRVEEKREGTHDE